MRLISLMFIVFLSLLYLQCSDCNCNSQKNKVRNSYGEPEETSTYSSSGYHSETWWYWQKGISFDFTWGKDVNKCCDKSTYTFDPIYNRQSISKDDSLKTYRQLQLIESFERNISPY